MQKKFYFDVVNFNECYYLFDENYMPRKIEKMKLSDNNAYSAIINRVNPQDYRRKYSVVV